MTNDKLRFIPNRLGRNRAVTTNGLQDEELWGLVLAGGDGVRLRELTRVLTGRPMPKQYCRIIDDRSLLELTLSRIAPLVSQAQTLVILNRDHLALAEPQLAAIPDRNRIVQPDNRDTGPGILRSLLHLARIAPPGATAVILPSDHHVLDPVVFRHHLRRAVRVARSNPSRVVLLGIVPDRAETGFGYVVPGQRLSVDSETMAFHVNGFCEKPPESTAVDLVAAGALWNSFVMAFRLERLIGLITSVVPDAVTRLSDPPPWNFSRDVLTRIPEDLVVVRADGMGWSDWGTPESVTRTLLELRRRERNHAYA